MADVLRHNRTSVNLKCSVEICVEADSPGFSASVEAAVRGGADRIELCARMDLGGTTPSADAIQTAGIITSDSVELLVMIRPRGGDFCYDQSELLAMSASIIMAGDAGASGVVFGVLRAPAPDNREPPVEIDGTANAELLALARNHGLTSTFHRAIDVLPHPAAAATKIELLGFDRLLLSGIPWEGSVSDYVRHKTISSVFESVSSGEMVGLELVLAGGITPATAREWVATYGIRNIPFSLHAYSGVLSGEKTSYRAVAALVASTC